MGYLQLLVVHLIFQFADLHVELPDALVGFPQFLQQALLVLLKLQFFLYHHSV